MKMKNIEQILKEAGLEVSEEQLKGINAAVTENYRTINDYNNQVKKTETAEADRDTYKGQLDTANETLEKFKDIDPEKISDEVKKYKEEAENARKDADARILERDQRDWLNNKLGKDGYNVKSPRAKDSLISDILSGKTGAKWDAKTQQFFGIDDLMKSEKEKDASLYETEEEKAEAEAKEKAAGSAPKFTDKSTGKPADVDEEPSFNFGFTPIREVKKGD